MNSYWYVEALWDHLLPFMGPQGCDRFLQDGAPYHTAKAVKAFLTEEAPDMQIMDCPGNSPDLNPMDNCWARGFSRPFFECDNLTLLNI